MRQIYVRDLACYQKLSVDQVKKSRISDKSSFRLPDGLSEEMMDLLERYLKARAEVLSLDSQRAEIWKCHTFCRFLCEKQEGLSRLTDKPLDELIRSLKAWMLKNGYALTGTHNRLNTDSPEIKKAPLISYLEALYEFASPAREIPETEKDIWNLSMLGFPVTNNPVHPVKSLNFTMISQGQLREETKHAVSTTIRYLSAATINGQLRAMKRLSKFLSERHPDIESALSLNRDVMEDYLMYVNTQVKGKKSFRSEFSSLKSILDTICLCNDAAGQYDLLLPGDISDRGLIKGYQAYTDEEMKMWNEAILTLPPQVARVLVIHQLLGNRISETLSLTQDCICRRGGHDKVKIFMSKSQKTVFKPAGDKVKRLIERAMEETNAIYGEREYVFVSDKDPNRPMTYATVQYHLMKMIRQLDLRNDNGELYGVGTHAFRHTMGRKLTQMHYDDKTIAQLLGHSSIESVHRYRKFASRVLADETRQVREKKDDLIRQMAKEWDNDEV